MNRTKWIVGASVFAAASGYAADSFACSATETEVYRSSKTVWCVEQSVITKYGAFPQEFFPFGDNVIDEMPALFKVPPAGIYTFEASVPNGGAHTGSECCNLGVTVTGDAFYNDAYNAKGFWGYLLSLHETINDWTGQVSSGWPTDFWADHVSAFPNSMDWHIMATLGQKDNDNNLIAASAGQKARFYPGGDSVDPRVGMFDQIFDLPNYGYDGLSRVFGWVESDKVSWDNLGVPNPDVKRTEYVMAYLSLGAGKPVTSIMKGAHVGDGTDDGAKQGDKPYTVNDANIDAIATAHCAIVSAKAQGTDTSSDEHALQSGDYANVKAAGACGQGCPAECGCKTATNKCVAPWLTGAVPSDAGTGGGSGGSSGGTTGGGSGGTTGGGSGGATGGGSGGATGGGSGGATGGGSGGAGGGGNGGGNGAGGGGNGAGGGGTGASGCAVVGGDDASTQSLWLVGAAVVIGLGSARRRPRRR
jgi:hypothetical protein